MVVVVVVVVVFLNFLVFCLALYGFFSETSRSFFWLM